MNQVMVLKNKMLKVVELHRRGKVDLALSSTYPSSIGSRVDLRVGLGAYITAGIVPEVRCGG